MYINRYYKYLQKQSLLIDHDELAAVLHNRGYRLTAQRQMVLDAVGELGRHASPEEVYLRVHEKSSAINRATVYRVLSLLREVGLLSAAVHSNGRIEYEITGQESHHHLHCRSCGADHEFSDEAFVVFTEALSQQYGFQVESDHLILAGLCADCSQG